MRSVNDITGTTASRIVADGLHRFRNADPSEICKSRLRSKDGEEFCLLGFIGDEAVKRGFAEWRRDYDDCFCLYDSESSMGSVSALPRGLCEALGLDFIVGISGLLAGLSDSLLRMESEHGRDMTESVFARSKLTEIIRSVAEYGIEQRGLGEATFTTA